MNVKIVQRNLSKLLIVCWTLVATAIMVSVTYQPVFLAGNRIQDNDTSEDMFRFHNFNTTFFMETGYNTKLNSRQACAVESAAIAHRPNYVVVYMSGFADQAEIENANSWAKMYDNIKLVRFDPDVLFTNTVMEKVFHSRKMQYGQYRVEHVADYARVFLLHQYGGLYLDLDFIILKPFLHLGQLIARESTWLFVNGLLRLRAGDYFNNEIFKQLIKQEYNPDHWIGAGPGLITTVAREACNLSPENENDGPNKCNVTVKGKEFFPVTYDDWTKVFSKDVDIGQFKPELLNESMAVHFNNFLTRYTLVSKDGNTILNQLAKKYCPEAYKQFPSFY